MIKIGIAHSVPSDVIKLSDVLVRTGRPPGLWTAYDMAQAVRLCSESPVDLVLLDPRLTGGSVQGIRDLVRSCGCQVLLASRDPAAETNLIFDAMGAGAIDVAPVPDPSRPGSDAVFSGKIAVVEKLIQANRREMQGASAGSNRGPTGEYLIALGASTGGPQALLTVIGGLPKDSDISIVVVQHVDEQMAPSLVSWLAAQVQFSVSLISVGDIPVSGTVHVAGTNDHLVMTEYGSFDYTPEPRKTPYRPSVDVFFDSLAAYWPARGSAALLTGMGQDGARGLLALRKAGWRTVAQDALTSVVFGMPGAAVKFDAAELVLPVGEIAPALLPVRR